MNKDQVAQVIADRVGGTKKEALAYVDTFLDVVKEQLIEGESVSLVNFGKFETKLRKERIGINPQTKEEMKINALKTVRFNVGKGLREDVKNS